MGITYVKGTVTGKRGKKQTLKFLVDSGAGYTLLPEKVWRKLGLKPKRTMDFVLADGTEIKRKVSECYIKLAQGEGHTPIVLGEGADEALLGVITLEMMGLMLNPFDRTLQPMRMMLASALVASTFKK
jgi:clan AA aspartic protease